MFLLLGTRLSWPVGRQYPAADADTRRSFLAAYDAKHQIEQDGDKAFLVIGQEEFPVPIPIVRKAEQWTFDTAAGRVIGEVRLEGVPKAAQIARYAPDNSLISVTSLNSDTVSLIDPSFRQQTAIKVGCQPMDMAFRGDELFVACQGDGSVHVIDIPNKRSKACFSAGKGCESLGFF